MRDIPDITNVTPGEMEAIINLLIENNGQVEQTKQDFERLFAPRKISSSTIFSIRATNKKRIKAGRVKFIHGIESCNMSHRSWRLKFAEEIAKKCMEGCIPKSVIKSDNRDTGKEYDVIMLPDYQTALKALQIGGVEMKNHETIALEKEKHGINSDEAEDEGYTGTMEKTGTDSSRGSDKYGDNAGF